MPTKEVPEKLLPVQEKRKRKAAVAKQGLWVLPHIFSFWGVMFGGRAPAFAFPFLLLLLLLLSPESRAAELLTTAEIKISQS